jgi:hypothetical protein
LFLEFSLERIKRLRSKKRFKMKIGKDQRPNKQRSIVMKAGILGPEKRSINDA